MKRHTRMHIALAAAIAAACFPLILRAQNAPATSTVNYPGGGVIQAGDAWESFLPQSTTPSYSDAGTYTTLGSRNFIRLGNFDRAWTTPGTHWPAAWFYTNYWYKNAWVGVFDPDTTFNPAIIGGKANPSYFANSGPSYGQLTYKSTLDRGLDPRYTYAIEPFWVDGTRRQHAVYEAWWPTNAGINVQMRAHGFAAPNWNNLNDFVILEVQLTNTGALDMDMDGVAEKLNNTIKALAFSISEERYMSVGSYGGGSRNANDITVTPLVAQAAWIDDPDPSGSPWAFSALLPSVSTMNPPVGSVDMGFNTGSRKWYTDVWSGFVMIDVKSGSLPTDRSKSVVGNATKKTIFNTDPIGTGTQRGWYMSAGSQAQVWNSGHPKAQFLTATGVWFLDGGKSRQTDVNNFNLNPNPNYFANGAAGDVTTFVPKTSGAGRPDGDFKSSNVFDNPSYEDGTADKGLPYLTGWGKFSKGCSNTENFNGDMFAGVGPFSLAPGESMTIVMATVAGYRLEGIQKAVRAARWAYQQNYSIPVLPPVPDIQVTTTVTKSIAVEWDNRAESDPEFAGYKIYKSSQNLTKYFLDEGMRVVDRYQENMTPGPIPTSLKKPVNPKFDAFGQVASSAGQGSYKPDTWGTWDLVQVVPKSSLPAYSSATTPGYRYRYEDNNIVYGFSYWYYVAAYKEGTYVGPDGETTNRIETHSTNRNGATGLWALTFPFAFQNANYGKLATTDAAASTKGLKNIGAPVLGSFPSTPLLIASSPPTSRKMEDIVVEIRLVDSSAVAKLFGIGFDLNYSNTSYIDFVSADTSGCFLGRDLLYILNSSAAGKISIGLSQKAPAAGIAGGGKLIQLVFRARATAPDNGACGFSLSSVTATDKSANPITLAAISSLTTITSNVVVWPGDTDTSGVVNQVDVLPLGLHWGRAGSPRPSGTSLWVAQYAIPLVPQSATYADANGDGIVNQGDLLPIGLNWGKTHSLSKTSSRTVSGQSFAEHANTLGTPVLRPIGPTSVKGKVTFEVSISLGDSASSVSSLFGLAFILDFSGSKGMIQALLVTQGDFLGNDVVFFPQIDNGAGTVAIGMTQKLGAKGAAGFGRVAKVTFQIVNAVPFVMLTTRDVVANDPNGNPIWILPSSSSVLVSTESSVRLPSEFQLYQNYPNPFNPSTKVSYGLPKRSQVNLTILDLLGRTVTTLIDGEKAAGSHDVMWDASAVPSGIYFYRLQAGEFVDTKKMILLK